MADVHGPRYVHQCLTSFASSDIIAVGTIDGLNTNMKLTSALKLPRASASEAAGGWMSQGGSVPVIPEGFGRAAEKLADTIRHVRRYCRRPGPHPCEGAGPG